MAQVHRVAKEIRSVCCSVLSSLGPFLSPTRPGDIFYPNAAGQPIVILNSRKVAVDLLERRAGIYSDRPTNIVACELMCDGLFFVFARYGDM
jgi:hypothetical protein